MKMITYAHMCRDEHQQIGHSDSEHERCPLCRANDRADALRSVMYHAAHLAAPLGSGSEGRLRGRFMSISNALNAAIGRGQSSHGDQYDAAGNIVRSDPLNT